MDQPPRLLFGNSALIAKLLDESSRYARTAYPILIVGDRGTGKTVLAPLHPGIRPTKRTQIL